MYWTTYAKTVEDIKKSVLQPYVLISVIKQHGRKDEQNKQSLETSKMYVENIEEEEDLGVWNLVIWFSIIFQVSVNLILH